MQRFVFIALLLISTPALADEAASIPASLSFQYSGLKYTQTRTKFNGTVEGERKVTSLLSGDLVDSYIYATINGKLNLYFYPFQDANSLLSVGYMLKDTLEIGIDIGLNKTTVDEPKSEVSSDLWGGFVTWTVPFEGMSLENMIVLDFSSAKTSVVDSTSEVEDSSRITGSFTKIASNIVMPIAKNAYYVGGVWIASDYSRNHALDATRKSTQWGLMLAGLRITVE